jgi:hypothetical protein
MIAHSPKPEVGPSGSDPECTWLDRENVYASPRGRGADSVFSDDEVVPTRRWPAAPDFDAPLHTPYGTAERTDLEFWGHDPDFLQNRRPLLPEHAVMENSWNRNPHEFGLQRSYVEPQVYETKNKNYADFSTGALSVRSNDIKETSRNIFASFTQSTNREFIGADPFLGNGAGGMGPVLGPYLDKKGTQQKPETYPDYVPPAGGAGPGGVPKEPDYFLPGATRRNRTYPQGGHGITGGFVADFGNDSINPKVGGRPGVLNPEYESWTFLNGGYVSSGPDLSINDPNSGARFRFPSVTDGGNDPIFTSRSSGAGSSLENNPSEGGRPTKLRNFDTALAGGLANGVAGGPDCNDVTGGMFLTKTEGVVGHPPAPHFGSQFYGGDFAFGIQRYGPRVHRLEQPSIVLPGASGRGTLNSAGMFTTRPNTIINEKYGYDDTPDASLQDCARRTLGAKKLLDFSRLNLDDLALTVQC